MLNLPIAELNNHTLREVFEVNNAIKDPFFNQTTYWSYVGESYYDSINKKGVLLSTSGAYTSIVKHGILNINDIYYGNFQIDSITSIMTSDSFNNIIYSNAGFKSFIETAKLSYYELKRYGVSPVNAVLDNIYVINLTNLGITSLNIQQMDYWFNCYQALLVSDTNAFSIIQNYASKTLEAWLTPTLTGATSTYIRYRKDTLGTVIVEGNITVTPTGTNMALPVGYRPLFAYTIGNLTFNTNGTVVSSATGTQTLSVRYTGA